MRDVLLGLLLLELLLCGVVVVPYAYYCQVVAAKCGRCRKLLWQCRCCPHLVRRHLR